MVRLLVLNIIDPLMTKVTLKGAIALANACPLVTHACGNILIVGFAEIGVGCVILPFYVVKPGVPFGRTETDPASAGARR